MKWTGIFFAGYVVLVIGLFAAAWKARILEQIGTTWTVIALVIALGVGIMFAVTSGGEKRTIEVEKNE